jgi:hypothetical protein
MAGSIYDWSTTAGTNASADGDINWSENQLPSTVNDSARVMMKRVAEYVKDNGALSFTGTDTITVTANSAFTSLATGRALVARIANDNTSTTVTLNVNGLGAKRVKVMTTAGESDPEAGSLQAGAFGHFVYDAAANGASGAWILLNPVLTASLSGSQPLDADLTAIAALTSAANKVPYSTGAQAWALADFTTTGRAIVAATVTADQILYGNGANTVTTASLTAAGRNLIDDADAAAQRTTLGLGTMATQAASAVAITGGTVTGITDLAVADGGTGASDAAGARTNLGLVIGTNVQAYDADLQAIAALTSAANKVPYSTGPQAWALADLTTAGRNLIDDADAAAQRTTLGLTSIATQTYEEGTFTPVIAGTTTPGSGGYPANGQIGRYTRIGNRVFFNIYLEWTSLTGTGNLKITGLPFTSSNVTNNNHALSVASNSITLTANHSMIAYIVSNTTEITLATIATGGGGITGIAVDTTGTVRVSGHYEI